MNKISVIIPNYNHAKYLPECLDSILSQSYKADEIILIDDGSTDNSVEVIQTYQKQASEIVLLRNEKNSGPHFAFNRGIKIAKNELIFGSSADDIILQGFFQKAVDLFNQSEEIAFVCSAYSWFHDQKPYKFISNRLFPYDKPKIIRPEELIDILRKTNFSISSNSCIYKKEYISRYGGYNQKLMSLTDYYLNMQIAFRHPIGYLPEPFGAHRLVTASYGRSIRFNWKKRLKLLDHLMQLVFKEEDKKFTKAFVRSGILSFNGYFMILYLFLHPCYWLYFPFITYKVFKKKILDK